MDALLPAPQRSTRGVAVLLGIPFVAGLALLTLTPSRVEEKMPALLDLVLSTAHRLGWEWLDFTRLEIIANVLVFVPIGVFAFLLVPRRVWPLAVVLGPALSIAIEVSQHLALPQRAATVNDVIANSAGALIGVSLAIVGTLLFAPRATRPRRTLEAS
ncbi:VanZ family protein [Microbacterium sp. 1.5R]|uniref:VanZ family protein n=1 Tax=Microbacterium sp. 1.5R TaxID=1916917 RepID=UPI0011A880AA|nr:VanZ family protein [Microbacterium sp. 1.5R]